MKRSLLILCHLVVYTVFCQNDNKQANKDTKNLGDLLTLKKVITINVPSISEGNSLKIKVKNGFLYLLNDDFITNEGLILIRENIETNIRDTHFINTEFFMSNINDFDINGDNLFILSNNQIITSNLVTKATRNDLISFHANLTYHHFFNINPETFIFYEWKIGQRNIEEKNIYRYDVRHKKWELIDSNKIDGLNFLAINRGNKYIDLNEHILAKFKPNKYEIVVKNFQSKRIDTISRTFDSSVFISSEYIQDIHAKYQRLLASSLFDSMDKHCYQKSQIRSVRVDGDSVIYIHYDNRCTECEWFPERKSTRYLDIWKYNKKSNAWNLYLSDLRLDNQSVCERFDGSKLKKDKLFFSLLGVETEWCVYSNLLFVPKIMSDKIDLNGDLSLSNSLESRSGSQNVHIFVFEIY